MHETVTSPTEYRSRHGVRLMVMPASCRGAMRTTLGLRVLGVTPGQRPPLPIGIVWGGPGRCWRDISRGSQEPPDPNRGHPRWTSQYWQGCGRRLGLEAPARTQSLPAAEQVAEPRRSHFPAPGIGDVRPQSVAPAERTSSPTLDLQSSSLPTIKDSGIPVSRIATQRLNPALEPDRLNKVRPSSRASFRCRAKGRRSRH